MREWVRTLQGSRIRTTLPRREVPRGQQKINLHKFGEEFEPKAASPLPGSADLCFVIDDALEEFIKYLNDNNFEILQGPVARTGALGAINSVYIRDPDQNLIELSTYIQRNFSVPAIQFLGPRFYGVFLLSELQFVIKYNG